MNHELQKLDQAVKMLGECNTVEEAKKIHDMAEAARHYAQVSKLGLQASNYANEIKIRAERKMGVLLTEQLRHQGGRPAIEENDGNGYIVSLKEIGINAHQSSQYQKIAKVPEAELEEYFAEMNNSNDAITVSSVIKLLPKDQRKDEQNVWDKARNNQYKTNGINNKALALSLALERQPLENVEKLDAKLLEGNLKLVITDMFKYLAIGTNDTDGTNTLAIMTKWVTKAKEDYISDQEKTEKDDVVDAEIVSSVKTTITDGEIIVVPSET